MTKIFLTCSILIFSTGHAWAQNWKNLTWPGGSCTKYKGKSSGGRHLKSYPLLRYPGIKRDGYGFFANTVGEASIFKLEAGKKVLQAAGPLVSLQIGHGIYGSPRTILKEGSNYHLWYHIARLGVLPTEIWHAQSLDLVHWTPDAAPTLPLEGFGLGLSYPDQVADAIFLEHHNQTFLYYDAVDNPRESAKIGVAARRGSISNVIAASPV